MDVIALRALGKIQKLHVFDHALAKRCHAMAPWTFGLVYMAINLI
jgi:hypothetical protein